MDSVTNILIWRAICAIMKLISTWRFWEEKRPPQTCSLTTMNENGAYEAAAFVSKEEPIRFDLLRSVAVTQLLPELNLVIEVLNSCGGTIACHSTQARQPIRLRRKR